MVARYRTVSDEDLVEMIVKQGKTDVFSVLYERYSDKVYRKCLSFEKDRDSAHDLVHDVFLKVFLQLSKFEARARFSTWLYSITYNYCVEQHRKRAKMPSQDIDDNPELAVFDDDDDLEIFEVRATALKKAMEKVSPEDKAILLLKYQEDASIKELMELLNVSKSAVKMRLSRARQRAKEIIDEMNLDNVVISTLIAISLCLLFL
ncbi:MAG: RNA polymerase sigma factor [Bacteroidia bacterium]